MKKLKILSLTLLIIVALSMINTVNAAIAIKEAATQNSMLAGELPDYYYMSLQMKNAGQGLEGVKENVKPHLATCNEFALLYNFMISNYGVGYENLNNSPITINGNSHTTSNRKSIRSD